MPPRGKRGVGADSEHCETMCGFSVVGVGRRKAARWAPGEWWVGVSFMESVRLYTTVSLAIPPHSLDLDLDLLSLISQSGEPDLSFSVGLARRFAAFLTSGSASSMTCCAGVGDAAVCVWAAAYYGFQQSRRKAVAFGESAGFSVWLGYWCGYVFYRTHRRKCWRCAAKFGGSEV